MPRPVHFELFANDLTRAILFYTKTFNWKFERWDNSYENHYKVITGDGDEPGIDGGLTKRYEPAPDTSLPISSLVTTIQVDNIEHYLNLIVEHGGEIVSKKMAVPTVGWIAYFKDTEENTFGIIEFDSNAK